MERLRDLPWRSALYYLLTGLILVVPALANQYPLVYSDSGTYIATSRNLLPPIDRPIGYGFLIRAVTWQSTLWTVVFFQGAVSSWLVREAMRTLFPAMGNAWRPHVLVLSVLLLCSSLPWYASQLMPDVFSGLLALIVFLLLFGRGLSRWKQALLAGLLFLFAITHYSFLVMLLGLGVLLLWPARRWTRLAPLRHSMRRVLLLLAVPVLGILFCMGYNARHGHGFVLSPTSSLFLAGKLVESGVLRTHLHRTCSENERPLCEKQGLLNTTGRYDVWEPSSPLRNGLGLVEASKDLKPLVNEVISDPRNWPMLVWTSMLATAVQFTQVTIGSGLDPYWEESAPYMPMRDDYWHELSGYRNSMQQRGSLGFDPINLVARPLLFLSLIYLALYWPSRRRVRWWAFCGILLAFSILNAAATGALANVYDRLQARITWVIVLAALLFWAHRSKWVPNVLVHGADDGGRGRA